MDQLELAKRHGIEKCNQVTMRGYLVYNVILLGCYLLEVIKGSRTLGYYAIFAILSILPLVLMFMAYSQNHASENVLRVMMVGYAFFYAYTVFTTTSHVAFIYGALVAVFVIVYGNKRASLIFSAGLFILNALQVGIQAAQGEIAKADLPDIEIRLGFTLLYAIFIVMVTDTIIKNDDDKMATIEREKEVVSAMLTQILEISQTMTGDIDTVAEKMGILEDSVAQTKSSMQEVSSGTTNTADSASSQLAKTEEIQTFIEKVENVSKAITGDMNDANNEVLSGKEKIDELIVQVQASDDSGNKVSEEMEKLTSYASEMQGIVKLIMGITNQTSMLALNASIEAARVGEAGKGFAVVASEISNLAQQTSDATVDITSLITNIAKELDEVNIVVGNLLDNNRKQSEAAAETAESFETIANRTENIKEQTEELAVLVAELASSNESIVESIQTISSASEQVAAHSAVTLEASEKNTDIVVDVGLVVDELKNLADRLNELQAQA